MCDTTIYHKEDYERLWNALPSVFKNTSNNTFTINLQGRAIMGADASNPLGSYQSDQNKSHSHAQQGTFNTGGQSTDHYHGVTASIVSGDRNSPSALRGWCADDYNHGNHTNNTGGASTDHYHAVTISGNTGDEGGTDARPKNVRMNWIIKY